MKISIIIPIYNVEKYIRQCLESIINQSYRNLEIIIVNDGTKDNSMSIVEEYLSDERIKVINKENGGLSSARNRGLEIVTGDYVHFLDSDDWIDINLYENLVKNIIDEDVLIFNLIHCNGELTKKIVGIKEKIDYTKGYLYFGNSYYACWNKLYKREYLVNIKSKFIEGIIYEDVFWGVETLFQTDKVKYIDYLGYYYRDEREGSIMNTLDKAKESKARKSIVNNIVDFIRIKEGKLSSGAIIRLYLEKLKWEDSEIVDYLKININIKKEFKNLEKDEKIVIIEEIKSLLKNKKVKKFKGFSMFDWFYWKNRIINFKIFRRRIL